MPHVITRKRRRRSSPKRRARARRTRRTVRRAPRRVARRTVRRRARRSAPRAIIVRMNPGRTTFRRRRRRNVPKGFHLGRGTPSRSWLRNARRKRKNPRRGTWKKGWARKLRTTHRSAARRYKGRRNPPGGLRLSGRLKELFSGETWVNATFGMLGLSVSLLIPKYAAEKVHASLGRGYGGVATAAVGTALTSSLVAMVPGGGRAARGLFVGGMIGVATMLLSAISCKTREQLLPFEEQMIACSLPTAPSGGGLPSALASLAARFGPQGLSGSIEAVTAGEAAYRRALGVRDYINSGQVVTTAPGRRLGVSDYLNFAGQASSISGLSGPEQF